MPRNVVRLLQRPCAWPQWQQQQHHTTILAPFIQRTYASSTTSEPTKPEPFVEEDETPTPEEEIHSARVRDQRTIRDTQHQLDLLTTHIQKMSTHINQIPLQIHDPNVPVPYTHGFLQNKIKHAIPTAAEKVLANAERIRLNLRDLQGEEYTDRKDGGALGEFERELEGLSTEELEEKLKYMVEVEEPVLLERVEQRVQKVLEHAEQYRNEGQVVGGTERPNPFLKVKSKGKVETVQTTKAEGEKKTKAKPASQPKAPTLAEKAAALMGIVGQSSR